MPKLQAAWFGLRQSYVRTRLAVHTHTPIRVLPDLGLSRDAVVRHEARAMQSLRGEGRASALGNGEWGMGNGEWAMGNGQWADTA